MLKRTYISLILVVLMLITSSCKESIPEENPDDLIKEPILEFSSINEFKTYINNTSEQKEEYRISFDDYINLNSILSDSECKCVLFQKNLTQKYKNSYYIKYNNNLEVYVAHLNKETPIKEVLSDAIKETVYTSISDFDSIDKRGLYPFLINNIEMAYGVVFGEEVKSDFEVNMCAVIVDDYFIQISGLNEENVSETYEELVTSLIPDYGATDDSVIAMLDKIKALIPTGDEADNTQENDSADKNGTVTLNDSGSTTNQTVSEPSYGGETGDETYYEEEEYLFPEDYEFPVIPGISPDWKPNRNGKYPLKDGYTRDEMTLILACAIELDFGDMTFEEMSQVEFRLIEEDENEE